MNILNLITKKKDKMKDDRLNYLTKGIISDQSLLDSLEGSEEQLIIEYFNNIYDAINTYGSMTFKDYYNNLNVNDFKEKTNYNKALNLSDEKIINIIKDAELNYRHNGLF